MGSNPIYSSGGNPTYKYLAKKGGAKYIFIDSGLQQTAQWPWQMSGSHAAHHRCSAPLAMAYHMIKNNLQDQEFLNKYTVGFDAEHMPEGADPKENFKDYVLGYTDGSQDAEWASQICGTPEDVIRHLPSKSPTPNP